MRFGGWWREHSGCGIVTEDLGLGLDVSSCAGTGGGVGAAVFAAAVLEDDPPPQMLFTNLADDLRKLNLAPKPLAGLVATFLPFAAPPMMLDLPIVAFATLDRRLALALSSFFIAAGVELTITVGLDEANPPGIVGSSSSVEKALLGCSAAVTGSKMVMCLRPPSVSSGPVVPISTSLSP